jgi:regulator of protease activity HflC (stomatin/prohibitin superfamily)
MDFGSILGTLGLLGFVVFIAGAALAVAAASQNRSARGGVGLAVIGLVVGVLFSILGQGIIFVEPTQVAVVVNTLSGDVSQPLGGGTHVVFPVVQRVAAFYPVTQQEYTMSATPNEGAISGDDSVEARTNDGQTINLDITIIYQVNPEKAGELYQRWNQNYLNGFIRPTTRAIVRDVVSQYTAEQIFGEARTEIGIEIKSVATTRFIDENLDLSDMLIRKINFSPSFTEAIEQKVVAAQELERARTEAQTAQTQATGRANAAIAAAEGEAQSIEIRAKAQAEALRLVSEQIAANPSLIQYLYVQNLSDNVQLVLLPSNSPFLFDLNSLSQGALNTTTPPPTGP